MTKGCYHDRLLSGDGALSGEQRWRSNTVTEGTWKLMTGLLANDPGVHGIRYLAVGAGQADWDDQPVAPSPTRERLVDEVERIALDPRQITYLTADGQRAGEPTQRLEVTAELSWPDSPPVLREFGLFGGDATDEKDSGRLINYVVHPRVTLASGAVLQRRIRFVLAPQTSWLAPFQHWLGNSPTQLLVGIGPAYAEALEAREVRTIAELAHADPHDLRGVIPFIPLVQSRARARLALRIAAELHPPEALADRRTLDVIATPPADLAAEADVPTETVEYLSEQISVLELTLNHRYLHRVPLAAFADPSAGSS